jgi:hypothetical protein
MQLASGLDRIKPWLKKSPLVVEKCYLGKLYCVIRCTPKGGLSKPKFLCSTKSEAKQWIQPQKIQPVWWEVWEVPAIILTASAWKIAICEPTCVDPLDEWCFRLPEEKKLGPLISNLLPAAPGAEVIRVKAHPEIARFPFFHWRSGRVQSRNEVKLIPIPNDEMPSPVIDPSWAIRWVYELNLWLASR